jgi:hypothetical protein
MRRTSIFIIIFFTVLLVTTVGASIAWERIGRGLYDCTDDNLFGYFTPGAWVHALPGKPIKSVDKVIRGRSMSEPDAIKRGWSISKLWGLWLSLLATSVLISAFVAFRAVGLYTRIDIPTVGKQGTA